MKATAAPTVGLFAAGLVLAVAAGPEAGLAADPYGYRLKDSNRNVHGGPSGINIYPRQPYRSPLYQPRKPRLGPGWKASPGLNPLLKPHRDLRPWRVR
ncbi:MAG: hypothetical protein RLT05_34650 [Bauldia litoralis]